MNKNRVVDPFRLDGEVAVITGGSRGIGRAIAELYAARGAEVVICGRNETVGERTAAEIGGSVRFIRADVTCEDEVQALVRSVVAEFGSLTVLVNNAGPTDLLHSRDVDGPIGHISLENWRRVLERTLTSAFLPSRYALPVMLDQRHGAIVNISSLAAAQAMPGFDTYSASKGGLEALTRSIASGYGHLGIRCNAIRVGSIAVDHGDGSKRRYAAEDDAPDAWRRAVPPPEGQPADIAHAALFLAAPASAYVTGTVLPVDGGLGARSLMPWQTPRPEMLERMDG
ncbi:SDR family NAD(P)-dependent oxidoreductase [Rhodococcus rhodochrous]|uniref:SDR family NAD(P)-dependent oxidoreductase n=1 Tax=Rhodococcus rhodochrous TaxID=1829 RepID=UPI0006C84503|nr:SDR family NAD(P)-dependent oxidoreductase [Rhodococcus rhodochrous]